MVDGDRYNSGVQFIDSEKRTLYGRFTPSAKVPGVVRWVMKLGLVGSTTAANYLLLTLSIIFIIVSIFIFRMTSSPQPSIGPEELDTTLL